MHIWNEFVKWWATPVQFDGGWVFLIGLIVIGNFLRSLHDSAARLRRRSGLSNKA